VVFVVGDEEVEKKVKKSFENIKKKDFIIYTIE